MLILCSVYFQIHFSDVVRLGEHDTLTTDDGKHEDIAIDRIEVHEKYVRTPKVNDIAIVYLANDVKFTGKLKFDFFSSLF